jgi:hypothetical protein
LTLVIDSSATAPASVESSESASQRGLLFRNRFVLWCAFIAVHLWLGLINLFGPGLPLGDVTLVYKFWTDQALVQNYLVGIDGPWVYPILALIPMMFAASLGPVLYASTWLSLVMILNGVALGVLTGWGKKSRNITAGWWWVGFLVLLGPIALGRIDSITVPLGIVGVLLVFRQPGTAAAILTVATWIKVWPAAVLAALVIALRARRPIAVGAAAVSGTVVALALTLGSGWNVVSFVTAQAGRGLQVESPVSTIWLWLAAGGASRAFVYYDQEILTYQVSGDGTALVSALMTPVLACAALAVAVLGIVAARRGVRELDLLSPLALALVVTLITFNKVGSPQFIMWLAVPIISGIVVERASGGISFQIPATLAAIIALLTQLIYPYFYTALLSLNPVMLLALTTRNGLLFVLLGWAVVTVVRLIRSVNPETAFSPVTRTVVNLWPLR